MFLSRCGLFHTLKRFRRERKLKVRIMSDLFWADFGLARAFRVLSGLKSGVIHVL
jgi:hypothetical protein